MGIIPAPSHPVNTRLFYTHDDAAAPVSHFTYAGHHRRGQPALMRRPKAGASTYTEGMTNSQSTPGPAGARSTDFPMDLPAELAERVAALRGRSFLKEIDFTPGEWQTYLDLAAHLKQARRDGVEQQVLTGQSIALIFEKTSTRTRCAFEVAAFEQGAHTTYLDPASSQVGHKESVADTAKVLGRFFTGIEFRGNRQEDVETLAECAGVPVFNGLTDQWHPTQMLADALTIREHVGLPLNQVVHAYLGDARFNTGRSLLISSAMLGMDVRIVAPAAYQPPADVVQKAREIAQQTGATVTITDDVAAGVAGAHALSTDVWVSMGEGAEVWAERIAALRPYQLNAKVLAATGRQDTIVLHCLPAFHDLNTAVGRQVHEMSGMEALEITDEVFSGPASRVFDQAENRMHTIKAVLVAALAGKR